MASARMPTIELLFDYLAAMPMLRPLLHSQIENRKNWDLSRLIPIQKRRHCTCTSYKIK